MVELELEILIDFVLGERGNVLMVEEMIGVRGGSEWERVKESGVKEKL